MARVFELVKYYIWIIKLHIYQINVDLCCLDFLCMFFKKKNDNFSPLIIGVMAVHVIFVVHI